jgi:hypothetical protein
MPRQQGAFDWQGRLESQGTVAFGPSRWSSWCLFAVAVVALLGFGYAVASGGPAVWSVIGVLVMGACAVLTARSALLGSGELRVTHEGVRMGRGPVVAFDRVAAIGVARQHLTVHYATSPGGRRPGGQKRMIVTLSRLGSFHPDDLAVWLLKLKGGPSADVVEEPRVGISRVFRLRE